MYWEFGSIVTFHLTKLWKAKFFILWYVLMFRWGCRGNWSLVGVKGLISLNLCMHPTGPARGEKRERWNLRNQNPEQRVRVTRWRRGVHNDRAARACTVRWPPVPDVTTLIFPNRGEPAVSCPWSVRLPSTTEFKVVTPVEKGAHGQSWR